MIADWLLRVVSNMVVSHAVSLLLLVSFNLFVYLRGEKTPLFYSYILLSSGPFFWLLGKLIKIVAPVLWLRWSGIIIQYLGVDILGPAFFIFCYVFWRGIKLPPKALTAVLLVPAAVFLLTATNPLHNLFYTTFTLYRDSFGPIHIATKYLTYFYLAAGAVFLLMELARRGKTHGGQILLFILAAAVPLVANFYYPGLGDKFTGLTFDITPVAFNLTFVFFGIAVFRYDFLGIPRIAHAQVLSEMPEGIAVKDDLENILYTNSRDPETRELLLEDHPEGELPCSEKWFELKTDRIQSGFGGRSLSIRRLIDITDITERKEQIKEKTKTLEALTEEIKEKIAQEEEALFTAERTRMAQEVHDILGHSLTLLISQLEAVKFETSPEKVRERMIKIKNLLKEGREELVLALTENDDGGRDGVFRVSTQAEIIIERAKTAGREIELIVKGEEPEVPSETAVNILAIMREAITNAFRHGGADHIVIILSYDPGFTMLIMDNGAGCETFKPGTGLTGMRTRAEKLGTEIEFSPISGEGFSVLLRTDNVKS